MPEKRHTTLRARVFILEDENGEQRAALSVDKDDNALIHFNDKEGRNRLFVGVTPEGTPRVSLQYAHGKGSIQLEANDRINSAALIIAGPTGRAQVLLGIAPNGAPLIALLDQDGKRVFPLSSPDAPDDDSGSKGFDWDQLLRH